LSKPLRVLVVENSQEDMALLLRELRRSGFDPIVTGQKPAEKALWGSSERIRNILDSITDAFLVIDHEGRFTYLNPQAEFLLQREREELLGRSLWDEFPEHAHPPFAWQCQTAITEQVSISFEQFYPLLHTWFEVHAYPSPEGLSIYFRDITARKLAEDTIRWQAHHDVLTGLPNRTLFLDRLEQLLAISQRKRSSAAVAFVDLDRFKQINDTLGHAVGDRLLQEVADRLAGGIRAEDTIARMGGDEFTLLLPDLDQPEDAAKVAHKLLATLKRPLVLEGQELTITASVGISVFPHDGRDAQALLKNADVAMYRAKEQGGDGCQLYAEAMNAAAFERLVLENHLRKAITLDELTVLYQPQVALATGRIIGVEALVRWRHPGLGMVLPARFIPLAEEIGVIVPLGEWVLREVCRQAALWQAAGQPLRVAVNLSARQFRQRGLAQTVATALAETGLDPGWLDLELTETAIMENGDAAVEILQALKRLGVRLSVDDFGTGYSSLSYLRRFPLDVLKVDRSFVRDLGEDRTDQEVVRAVIDLAHALGLEVIAEGVETQTQWDCLHSLGCDALQGYLFSPAVSAEKLEALLQTTPARPRA
jgi:diguanylate cyclase (GGDEF)-like protein/PAS domain S-box-containing protein